MSYTINLTEKNREKNVKMFLEAKKISKSIKLDELDCRKSWTRQTTNFSFDNIFQKCLYEAKFSLVVKHQIDNNFCFSIATEREVNMPVYFIWIYLDYESGKSLLGKYEIIIPKI